MRNWSRYIGVYGVILRNARILVVNKTRGPYLGRYDLPGGGLESGESLQETLKRECLEETGYDVTVVKLQAVHECLVCERGEPPLHHIAFLYQAEMNEAPDDARTERHGGDVSGFCWTPVAELHPSNSSPLVMAALGKVREPAGALLIYDDWHRSAGTEGPWVKSPS